MRSMCRWTKVGPMLAVSLARIVLEAPALAGADLLEMPRVTTTEFALDPQNGNLGPFGITRGPDGALWFGENAFIGRVTTTGEISEFPLPLHPFPILPPGGPNGGPNDGPGLLRSIIAGNDDSLWFTEFGLRAGVARIGDEKNGSEGDLTDRADLVAMPRLPAESTSH